MKNEWMNLVWAACVLALLLVMQACNPTLTVESPQPPGRTARMESVDNWWGVTKFYKLEISEGVAMAVTCQRQTPCDHMQVTSDDPNVAELRPASFVGQKPMQQQPAAGLVIVGKAPGTTTLHVRTASQGHREILVTVVSAPGAPAPVTRAL